MTDSPKMKERERGEGRKREEKGREEKRRITVQEVENRDATRSVLFLSSAVTHLS